MGREFLRQPLHRLLRLEAQPRRHGQLLARKILDDGQVLQHEQPADGIGPAALSRDQLHVVPVRRNHQHILDRKAHNVSSSVPMPPATAALLAVQLCVIHLSMFVPERAGAQMSESVSVRKQSLLTFWY